MNEKAIADKMLYPLTDNEEAIDLVTAKSVTENYKWQAEVGVG